MHRFKTIGVLAMTVCTLTLADIQPLSADDVPLTPVTSKNGVAISVAVTQQLKDQHRTELKFVNNSDKELNIAYDAIRFTCTDGTVDTTLDGQHTLDPGEEKAGQWEGLAFYPCWEPNTWDEIEFVNLQVYTDREGMKDRDTEEDEGCESVKDKVSVYKHSKVVFDDTHWEHRLVNNDYENRLVYVACRTEKDGERACVKSYIDRGSADEILYGDAEPGPWDVFLRTADDSCFDQFREWRGSDE
jgi:hypothetical protein